VEAFRLTALSRLQRPGSVLRGVPVSSGGRVPADIPIQVGKRTEMHAVSPPRSLSNSFRKVRRATSGPRPLCRAILGSRV